jgi:tryptophanyl-tRNA synthetase
MLLEKLLSYFMPFRQEREKLAANIDYVHNILKKGADKARVTASATKAEVWKATGLML